jgi:outer membrane receptor protein involved in Fe transport
MRGAAWLLAAVAAMPLPVLAREAEVATRAGTASEAVVDLARQTGTSIVIADSTIARRTIPALRGRMDVAEALNRLARAAGARAVPVGRSAWRLEAARPSAPLARPTRETPRPAAPRPPIETHSEPIVVQATKRDLRIEDVPGQLAILDGKALETGGVGGTEKITRQLATVSSTHLGSGRNKLFIRGIADSSFTGPTQATVGQYLGDMRLTYNAPDPDLRLSDLARVEVLEGPQGTLYGAGSLGGIIRLVPNAPVMGETGGTVILGGSLTQHGAPGADASATVNLPVAGESVALRATFDSATYGGYIDKPLLGRSNVNRSNMLGGKLALRARIAPDWTIDVIALAQSTEADDSQYADRNGQPLESSARVPEGSKADYALGQLVVSGRIGDVNVRSTTGVVAQDLHEHYDASETGGEPRLFSQTNDTRMIVHETRVWQSERHGFGWLLGASYTHNRTVLNRDFSTPLFDMRKAATGVRNTIDEFTLYGEASLHLMGPLTATGGGRFTRSRLGGDGEDIAPAAAAFLSTSGVTARRTMNRFLPSFALNARFSPEDSLYLRYQEGFRPGGFAIESNVVRRFQSDRTGTFEMGARHGRAGATPFDLALSLSYTRWQDIQADFIDGSGLPSTANIGDGRVWSASISGGVLLAPGLRVELGATWNESKVDEPSAALVQYVLAPVGLAAATLSRADVLRYVSTRGMQVPNIARFAGHSALAWTHEVSADWTLNANAWANYIGRSRLGIGPELGAPQGNYFDSGFDMRLGTASYGVTLSVTNLADVQGNRFSLGTPFSTGREQVTPLRPRTVRVGLDARF